MIEGMINALINIIIKTIKSIFSIFLKIKIAEIIIIEEIYGILSIKQRLHGWCPRTY